jgi:hypothetical protein
VPVVEDARIGTVKMLYAHAEVRLGRLDDEVDVIVHQAVREAPPAVIRDNESKDPEVVQAVTVIEIDRLLAVPAGVHMVYATPYLFTRASRHDCHSARPPEGRPLN